VQGGGGPGRKKIKKLDQFAPSETGVEKKAGQCSGERDVEVVSQRDAPLSKASLGLGNRQSARGEERK